MLKYKLIHEVNIIRERQKSKIAYRWSASNSTSPEADKLFLFTLEKQAKRESQENLNRFLDTAREYRQTLLILHPDRLQMASREGSGSLDCPAAALALHIKKHLLSRSWNEYYGHQVYDAPIRHQVYNAFANVTNEVTSWGSMIECRLATPMFCLNDHGGVYDVESGKKISNRGVIVDRFWQCGFAAAKGRRLSMATSNNLGTRSDIEKLNEMMNQLQTWPASRLTRQMFNTYRLAGRGYVWPTQN